MHFFIRRLVLWPRDERFSKRELAFEPGKVNLITGQSGSGKSAILHIVDYVLGSSKCAIPVGPIRDTVEWYGLLVDLGHTKMVVARREPGDQIQSGDYFLHFSDDAIVPDRVSKNTNHPSFKNHLNRLAGLPSVNFDAQETGNMFLSRPGFRDMAAFNFLPQHIVANPYALFFKADTSEHRAKLVTIFPFVLGAVSAQHLVAEHEHALFEKQLRKLASEHAHRQRSNEAWKAEALGLYERAVELGLVEPGKSQPTTPAQCISILAQIPERLDTSNVPVPSVGATEYAATKLQALRDEETRVASDLADIRRRITRINNLRRATEGFSEAVANGVGRVQGVGWFQGKLKSSATCPVCGAAHDSARQRVADLAQAAASLSEHQQKSKQVPAVLDKEYKTLSAQAAELDETLRTLRQQRAEQEAVREASGGQRLDQVYRFAGRIEQSLINMKQVEDDAELRERIDAIRQKIESLQKLLDPAEKRRRMNVALRMVSEYISTCARFLRLERSADAVSLVVEELSLIFENPDSGRSDYLWEIGSGANWMGYHISTMLGLHMRFLGMELSCVPTFLIVDQPSQVYFPSGIPSNATDESHDVIATRKIFELLSQGLRESDYRLQIIVTEHADERTLGGVDSLHKVADWHGRDRDWLIPHEWIVT